MHIDQTGRGTGFYPPDPFQYRMPTQRTVEAQKTDCHAVIGVDVATPRRDHGIATQAVGKIFDQHLLHVGPQVTRPAVVFCKNNPARFRPGDNLRSKHNIR